MIYTKKDFKAALSSKEIKEAIVYYSKKYDCDYSHMDDDKFVDWLHAEYDFYIEDIFIEYKNTSKIKRSYPLGNKEYVNIQLYFDDESNLKTWIFILDDYRLTFKTKEEMYIFYNNFIKEEYIDNKMLLDNKVKKYPKSEWIEEKEFLTDKDFCGNFIKGKKEYCKGALINRNGNLGIWSIYLYGTDDYSISRDFYTEEEARKDWKRFKNNKILSDDDVTDYYFSN